MLQKIYQDDMHKGSELILLVPRGEPPTEPFLHDRNREEELETSGKTTRQ
jgi:hypothetical protein